MEAEKENRHRGSTRQRQLEQQQQSSTIVSVEIAHPARRLKWRLRGARGIVRLHFFTKRATAGATLGPWGRI